MQSNRRKKLSDGGVQAGTMLAHPAPVRQAGGRPHASHVDEAAIASSVEEQTATTNEIARNVAEAAKGSSEIASNISGVAQAAGSTTHAVNGIRQASVELGELAEEFRAVVGKSREHEKQMAGSDADPRSARRGNAEPVTGRLMPSTASRHLPAVGAASPEVGPPPVFVGEGAHP